MRSAPPVRKSRHRHNALLAAASERSLEHLLPHVEVVSLPASTVLRQAGDTFSYAWFPHEGVVSAVVAMADGAQIQAGEIGSEGCIGAEAILAADYAFANYVVNMPVTASRLPFRSLRAALAEEAVLRGLFLRYGQVLVLQSLQLSGCNALHRLEQRCCRWLLMARDRAHEDEFPMTHEALASMLGVRRASIGETIAILQSASLIRCRRGRVRVLERTGLEARACECYRTVRQAFDRLLPGSFA
jgi:CRP-like cAMP-binding protein